MTLLEKRGKGIILMHDIQPHTAAAMPDLLKELKAKGYKIVQLTAKAPVQTLPEYDADGRQGSLRHADGLVGSADEQRRQDDHRRTVTAEAALLAGFASFVITRSRFARVAKALLLASISR